MSTGILNFMNDTDALKIILVDLAVVMAVKLVPSLVATTTNLVKMSAVAIPRAISAWQLYMGVASGAEGVTIGLGTAINASIPIIGLVVAGLSLLVMGINKYKSSQEEARRVAIENGNTLKQEIDGITSSIKLIKDEKTSREEIISAVKNVNSAYAEELGAIDDVNKLREKSIELLDKEAKKKAKEYTETNQTAFEEALGRQSEGKSDFKYFKGQPTRDTALGTQAQIEAVKKYKDEVSEIREHFREGSIDYNRYTKVISESESELSRLYKTQKEDKDLIDKFNDSLSIQGKKWDDSRNQSYQC